MKVQVLVAAMHQSNRSLLDRMRICSDVIVGNQCDRNGMDCFDYKGFSAVYLNAAERGVGRNRNNAMLRAAGDICLFADEDLVYDDGYAEKVSDWFHKYPQADALIFNIRTVGGDRQRRQNRKVQRVRIYNALNYGAARLAVRRSSLEKHRLAFSLLFGGGALYSSGEDSLFIRDMLKNGMVIYAVPETLGAVDQSTSTWFDGYHQKFFFDKGALMKAMFPRMYWLMDGVYFPLRYHAISGVKRSDIRRWMLQGSRAYEELRGFEETR